MSLLGSSRFSGLARLSSMIRKNFGKGVSEWLLVLVSLRLISSTRRLCFRYPKIERSFDLPVLNA